MAASRLSAGAQITWRIAAAEAAATGHASIDVPHVLAAVLSLDKVDAAALRSLGGAPGDLPHVQQEAARISGALAGIGGGPAALRRAVRGSVPRRQETPAPGATMRRTPEARAAFDRAAELAGDADADTLHLLRALVQQAPPAVTAALRQANAAPEAIAARAFLATHLAALEARVLAPHGVRLRAETDALQFLAVQPDLGAALARTLDAPLEKLASSGLLQRHRAWRAVYDEGGIYLLPEETPAPGTPEPATG